MRQRADNLADQFEAVHREVIAFCESLSDVGWETIVPNEERTVGVLIHHIAVGYTAEADLLRAIVNGQPLPAIYADRETLDEMNALDAVRLRAGTKADAVRLLDHHAGDTARYLRTLTDDDLGKARPLFREGALWTVDQVIGTIVLGHPRWHLASIREALAAPTTHQPA